MSVARDLGATDKSRFVGRASPVDALALEGPNPAKLDVAIPRGPDEIYARTHTSTRKSELERVFDSYS